MHTPSQSAPFRKSVYRKNKKAAFTLVEVTLALGVLVFSFISVFGLLSTSMEMARTSMEKTHVSRIFQRLVTEMQQLPFAEQSDLAGVEYLFDGEAELLKSNEADQFVYSARIQPATAAMSLGLPSNTLNRFTVEIVRNHRVAALDAANQVPDSSITRLPFATADMAF